MKGIGDPMAKQGSFVSFLKVAVKVSLNDAILAGTFSSGVAAILSET
jgi:hypothetical protein